MNESDFKRQIIASEVGALIDKIEGYLCQNPEDSSFAIEQMLFIQSVLSDPIPTISVKSDSSQYEKTFTFMNSSRSTSNWITPEKYRISKRVENWIPENSSVWKNLQALFGERVQFRILLDLAQLISEDQTIQLDRDAKRRKVVLVKWFEEHWDQISPIINNYSYNHGKIIRINENT